MKNYYVTEEGLWCYVGTALVKETAVISDTALYPDGAWRVKGVLQGMSNQPTPFDIPQTIPAPQQGAVVPVIMGQGIRKPDSQARTAQPWAHHWNCLVWAKGMTTQVRLQSDVSLQPRGEAVLIDWNGADMQYTYPGEGKQERSGDVPFSGPPPADPHVPTNIPGAPGPSPVSGPALTLGRDAQIAWGMCYKIASEIRRDELRNQAEASAGPKGGKVTVPYDPYAKNFADAESTTLFTMTVITIADSLFQGWIGGPRLPSPDRSAGDTAEIDEAMGLAPGGQAPEAIPGGQLPF